MSGKNFLHGVLALPMWKKSGMLILKNWKELVCPDTLNFPRKDGSNFVFERIKVIITFILLKIEQDEEVSFYAKKKIMEEVILVKDKSIILNL